MRVVLLIGSARGAAHFSPFRVLFDGVLVPLPCWRSLQYSTGPSSIPLPVSVLGSCWLVVFSKPLPGIVGVQGGEPIMFSLGMALRRFVFPSRADFDWSPRSSPAQTPTWSPLRFRTDHASCFHLTLDENYLVSINEKAEYHGKTDKTRATKCS